MEGWRGRRGAIQSLYLSISRSVSLSISLYLGRVWRVGIPESSLLALFAGAEAVGGDELDMTVDFTHKEEQEREGREKGYSNGKEPWTLQSGGESVIEAR